MIIKTFHDASSYMNYLILLETYVVLESGSLCSDAKSRPVKDVESCRSAVPKLQNLDQKASFEEEERTEFWPSGCYLTNDGVYFNSHSTGGRNPSANHICRRGIYNKIIE